MRPVPTLREEGNHRVKPPEVSKSIRQKIGVTSDVFNKEVMEVLQILLEDLDVGVKPPSSSHLKAMQHLIDSWAVAANAGRSPTIVGAESKRKGNGIKLSLNRRVRRATLGSCKKNMLVIKYNHKPQSTVMRGVPGCVSENRDKSVGSIEFRVLPWQLRSGLIKVRAKRPSSVQHRVEIRLPMFKDEITPVLPYNPCSGSNKGSAK